MIIKLLQYRPQVQKDKQLRLNKKILFTKHLKPLLGPDIATSEMRQGLTFLPCN